MASSLQLLTMYSEHTVRAGHFVHHKMWNMLKNATETSSTVVGRNFVIAVGLAVLF